MEDFRSYLLSKQIVSENKLVYYLVWVNQFYVFCDKIPGDNVSTEEIDGFVKHLMKNRGDWQVKQAKEAIQLFIYYTRRKSQTEAKADLQSDTLWRPDSAKLIRVDPMHLDRAFCSMHYCTFRYRPENPLPALPLFLRTV